MQRTVESLDPVSPERLRPYLPPWLARRLQPQLTAIALPDLEAIGQHLSQLLRVMATYLPRQAVNDVLADPVPGRVHGSIVPGTVVMADITGFTALSERIAHLGREGAEEITGIVNRYFTHMSVASDRQCGFVTKFAGDAMMIMFTGEDHARRAVRAAVALLDAMQAFEQVETSQGTFSLQVKMGIGSGDVFTAHVGTTERMEYLVMGQAVRSMMCAEDSAQAGECVLDEESFNAVRDLVVRVCRRGDFYVMHRGDFNLPITVENPDDLNIPQDEEVSSLSHTLEQITVLIRKIETLAPYLPYGLVERLALDPGQPRLEGEHRLVTTVFADVHSWEPLVSALGRRHPQRLTAVLNAYFTAMHGVVHRYGGVVNKVDPSLHGQRLMALFGAPVAHEDDEERAVLAALEMRESLDRTERSIREAWAHVTRGEPMPDALRQRIGTNTGFVFASTVGDHRRQEYSIMGDEVNLAARLVGVSENGQILISASTYRKVADRFAIRERPAVRVKGKALPVQNYEVLGAHPRAAQGVRRTALVGRPRELRLLHKTLDRVAGGPGKMLAITGDLGVGKTRLLEELHDAAENRGFAVLHTHCLSYGQNVPYLPWSNILRAYMGFGEEDDAERRAARASEMLQAVSPDLDALTPLLNPLLGLDLPDNELTRHLDAKLRRQRLFDLLLRLFQHAASRSPLLLAIDDLQWLDAASRDLLKHIARNLGGYCLLIAVAYRTEPSTEEWDTFEPCEKLAVGELPAEDSRSLVAALLGGSAVPAPLQQLTWGRTQGNPFFLEEIVRTLVDRGAIYADSDGQWQLSPDWENLDVPDTIHGMLISRIDRLPEADRRLLQVASVIGLSFPVDILRGVYPQVARRIELEDRLHHLATQGLTLLDRPEPDMAYAFKHSMIHEVTYESLPYARRRGLHAEVGDYVEKAYAATLTERLDFLAHHYYLGRIWPKATDYAIKAGERAQAAYANEAAIAYYERALELIRRYQSAPPHTAATTAEALGDVYRLIGEYEPAIESYRLALDTEGLASAVYADLHRKVALVHQFRADYDAAVAELDRAEAALGDERDALVLARIGNDRGWIFARQGRYDEAEAACQQALRMLKQVSSGESSQRARTRIYDNMGSICRFTGEYDRSIAYLQDSLALKEELGDQQGVAIVYNRIAAVHWSRGDYTSAAEYMNRSLEIRERIGDRWGAATAYNNLGIVYYTQGQYGLAEACYQQALSTWQEVGGTSGVAFCHVNLGELYFSDGKLEDASWHLEQGERLLSDLGERSSLIDVRRWLAQVRLAQGRWEAAHRYAQMVLDVARVLGNPESEGIAERLYGQVLAAAPVPKWPAAEEHFRRGLEILAEIENDLELGRAHYQFALALRRIRPEREAEALSHLRQAEEIFRRIGASRDLAQVRDALSQRAGRP